MELRIHTVGASGSGTTTLAAALASKLRLAHFDADYFYWEPADPPYTTKRAVADRIALLTGALSCQQPWVLSGSIVNWGETFVERFTHVVFLELPAEKRLARIRERESQKFGTRIEPGGDMFAQHTEFINWACRYDSGGSEVRSRQLHEEWLKSLSCPVIRVSGELSTEEQVRRVLEEVLTLQVTDIVEGSGRAAVKGALMICDYEGRLEDGTKFDSSHDHGRHFEFVMGSGRVIKGWDQGLMGMREGGKRRLFVPSHLAYGERQVGKYITPNSNLIFDVELIKVRLRDDVPD